ncbi:MAG: acyl-CoA thioesterase [Muribaculaceae bacterium]|nr:acyl-CoA thioesterase [Muribaculaceae bacterium]
MSSILTPCTYVFEMPIKVRDYEVDAQGIVNNANYQHYLEHTRHMFCEQAGISFREMHESGLDPVVRRIEMDYLRPLGLGDSMVSKIALYRQGPLFVFRQDIFTPEGEPVVHAMVSIACLEGGRLTRGERLAEAFKDYL